jgi:hypothetical protein
VTDPLTQIEAVIEALGKPEPNFWTPLDTSQGRVSKAKPLENRGFGHFGRFGHHRGDTALDDLTDVHEYTPGPDARTTRASRASSPISRSVQSVQTVQSHKKDDTDQRLGFGHLGPAGVQNRGAGVQNPARRPEGVPAEWLEGIARLRGAPTARGYPPHAWQQLVLDAEDFLGRWGAQAARLDWPAWELFGCHRRAPFGRIQGMGLVLLLRGRDLVALTADEAVIRTATGVHQTYRRKPHDPLQPAERCLVWELSDA